MESMIAAMEMAQYIKTQTHVGMAVAYRTAL